MLVTLALCSLAQAAPAEPIRLSMEEALSRAKDSSERIAAGRAAVRGAEADVRRAQSGRWPQVQGTASYVRTLESEYDGLFEGTGGMGMFEDLPFGRANTWRAGLTASEALFTGGRISGQVDLAEAALENAQLELTSLRAQAILDAAQAYNVALLAERLLVIAERSLALAGDTLEVTRAGHTAGTVPEFDLLRAEVSRQNQRAVVVRRRADRNVAMLRLAQLLDLPEERPLVLTTTLDLQADASTASLARSLAEIEAVEERVPVAQAQANVMIGEASADIARAQHFPSLVLASDLGVVAYPADVFPSFDEFRTNWTVGLFIELPIFTGFRVTAEVESAEADVAAALARLRSTEELAELDRASTSELLLEAKAAVEASRSAAEQARRAYEIAEIRYREGLSTLVELGDARLQLEIAEANRAFAASDLEVARVRAALLPALPLAAPSVPVTPEPVEDARDEAPVPP